MLASTILAPFRNLAGGLKTDEQWPVGGFQRRRDRDHHHDHGAGDEGAARRPCARLGAAGADVSQLRLEFRLCRHLLEQPPSHAACLHRGDGCNALGQSAPVFWLSLFPFTTGWMGENHFTAVPTALYAAVLLMAAIAYVLLQQTIIRTQGPDSILRKA